MYGSISDLEGILPWKFTNVSRPTLGQVESMMDRHSATIDSVLASKGITVPIESVNSRAYKFCTQFVLYKTAAEVLRYRALETNDSSALNLSQFYEQLAAQLLEQATKEPQVFVGS